MAERVLIHIGLPKTGTSFLQSILWANRPELAKAGLLVPGRERRDHLWASREIRQEEPHLQRAPERHRTAWPHLLDEIEAWSGAALISHEFFAAAAPEQAQRMVAELAPARVELVVTAREPLGLFTSSWQESLKNGGTTELADYGRKESPSPSAIWNWRTLDLTLVLRRWTQAVPADRVHVIVPAPRAPRQDLWATLCAVVGVDPQLADAEASFANTSMGVVEAETLRRLNERLTGFDRGFDKGVYLRTFLADERLVPRDGESFWPAEDQVEDCRRRGLRMVDHLASAAYQVHGDPQHLLVPAELPDRRHPDSVTDGEVADVALDLVGSLLHEVRSLRRAAHHEPEARGIPARVRQAPAAVARRLRSRLRHEG